MKVIYRVHAVRRMFERSISEADVGHVLAAGDVIAEYLDDQPYPSRLICGFAGERPLHVVVAYNAQNDEHVIITVYEPDPAQWDESFRRRTS